MGDSRRTAVAGVLRDVARGGIAGLLAGTIVGGIGGRLVMLVIAQLNRDAFGQLTEAEAVIGRFTVDGTVAVIVFGGLGAGLAGGVLWVIASPWIPWTHARRWAAAMPVAVLLGAFTLVESTNFDFRVVGPTWLVLALLLGLVAVTGAATAWLDDQLDKRLPRAGADAPRAMTLYLLVALLGAPAVLLTASAFFSESYSVGPRPPGVGWALVALGLATAGLWASRIRRTPLAPPRALIIAGRVVLLAALALGGLHLAGEIGRLSAAV